MMNKEKMTEKQIKEMLSETIEKMMMHMNKEKSLEK